jgi:RHS repeat-associated protein
VTDHLGSTRLVLNGSGTVVGCHDYVPFGEEIAAGTGGRGSCYGAADTVNQKFTGKERDVETGLDYFGARYLSSAQGRWTSPDWSAAPQPVPYASLGDPQTLNLYAYVRNSPLGRADADGHCGGPGESDCGSITVTATVAKPAELTVAPPSGGKQTATVEGQVNYKMTYAGKPLANTPVHEEVTNKRSRDGKPEPTNTETRDAKTNDAGVIGDQTSMSITVPAMKGLAESIMTTSVNTKDTTQVLTMASPSGSTCQVTEKRTMTNADASGDASSQYTIKLQTPKQTATPAPDPNKKPQ